MTKELVFICLPVCRFSRPCMAAFVVDPTLQSGAELLDALCYIDHDIEEPGLREEVDRLIEEEMKRFRPR